MRAALDFRILDWTEDGEFALRIRVFSTDDRGVGVDEVYNLPEPMYPGEVATAVAKINWGSARRAGS